jgi:urease beta subunit
MTHKIYNQSKYVTQVARANDLTSFRNIPAGTALRFPPFDKQEV